MFKFLVILVVAVAAVATEYDFSGDYEFSRDEFPLSRQRRDTKVVDANQERCCDDGSTNANFKELLVVKKQCAVELKTKFPGADKYDPSDPEKWTLLKQLSVCKAECVFRAFDLIDKEGKLIRNAISKNFNPDGTEWKQKLVDSCWKQVEERQPREYNGCTNRAFIITKCIWSYFIIGCPVNYRVETPSCDVVRNQIYNNNDVYFTNKFL